jgi:Zn-dependent metalloprotease
MKKFILIMIAVLLLLIIGYVLWLPESVREFVASKESLIARSQQSSAPSSKSYRSSLRTTSKVASHADLKISLNRATNTSSFVMAPAGEVLFKSDPKKSQQANALAFFKISSAMFGIHDPSTELKFQKVETDNLGMSHLSFQQQYQGVDVFAATLKAHFNQAGDITVVNGTFVPNIHVNTTPSISSTQAQSFA